MPDYLIFQSEMTIFKDGNPGKRLTERECRMMFGEEWSRIKDYIGWFGSVFLTSR